MAVWTELDDDAVLEIEKELKRELCSQHPLYGKRFRVVARRFDRDDVAIEVQPEGLCVVHLTYRKESDPQWPWFAYVSELPDDEDDEDDGEL